MKCLTVCQPYAHAIVHGAEIFVPDPQAGGTTRQFLLKRVENRSWATAYRGPLLIHAGKSKNWLRSWGGPQPRGMQFGAILGLVELVDCVTLGHGAREAALLRHSWLGDHPHAEPGMVWWVFGEIPRAFDRPVPYKGAMGLFEVPEEVLIHRRKGKEDGGKEDG
jgi:activating signal cointegrator 1